MVGMLVFARRMGMECYCGVESPAGMSARDIVDSSIVWKGHTAKDREYNGLVILVPTH